MASQPVDGGEARLNVDHIEIGSELVHQKSDALVLVHPFVLSLIVIDTGKGQGRVSKLVLLLNDCFELSFSHERIFQLDQVLVDGLEVKPEDFIILIDAEPMNDRPLYFLLEQLFGVCKHDVSVHLRLAQSLQDGIRFVRGLVVLEVLRGLGRVSFQLRRDHCEGLSNAHS